MIAQPRRLPFGLIAAGWSTIAEQVIDKHRTMTDEAVTANAYQLAYEGVRLDLSSRTDRNTLLDFNERTDEALIAQFASVEIYRLDDGDVLPETDVSNAAAFEVGFHRMLS